MPTPIPVSLESGASPAGGLLASARSLPSGWERGIAFLDADCLLPTTMGECPTGENLKDTARPGSATFMPYTVIMPVECSTLGGLDVSSLASTELGRVTSFAVARELLTGATTERDVSPAHEPNPALVDVATDLGATFGSVAEAFGCVDAQLAEATAGRGGVLLIGPGVASVALAERAMWRDGATWRSAYGSRVIVDAGFDGRAPGSTSAPAASDPLYIYGVTDVWAGVGSASSYDDIARDVNTAHSRAEAPALAAFKPCAVFAAASTAATAC